MGSVSCTNPDRLCCNPAPVCTHLLAALPVAASSFLKSRHELSGAGEWIERRRGSGMTASGKEINAGLADPKLKARMADLGGVPMPMAPVGFGRFIGEETEKWGKVIRRANIKAE